MKLYLALNGAVHDAAIAAWGLKGYYDSVRPISMVRYMGGLGQSSDPDGPSYDPEGLPLVDDLDRGRHRGVERAGRAPRRNSPTTSARSPSGRWRGFPADPETETSGVGWILAVDWVPYQRSTFVTPAFPGYVSGHSTFSRAAAEVMAAFTGDTYFPGGLSEYTLPRERAAPRGGPDRGHHPAMGDLLRRRRSGRRVAASTWASTSPRTTSTAAGSGRRAVSRRGRSPRRYFDGTAR